MTVVVGLKFKKGIVLAADREESDDYLRDRVQKNQRLRFPNEMIAGIYSLCSAKRELSYWYDVSE